MDKAVKLFLAKHTDFEPVEYEGKLRIKCSLTGHEMPPKLNLLEEHQKSMYSKRVIVHEASKALHSTQELVLARLLEIRALHFTFKKVSLQTVREI